MIFKIKSVFLIFCIIYTITIIIYFTLVLFFQMHEIKSNFYYLLTSIIKYLLHFSQ